MFKWLHELWGLIALWQQCGPIQTQTTATLINMCALWHSEQNNIHYVEHTKNIIIQFFYWLIFLLSACRKWTIMWQNCTLRISLRYVNIAIQQNGLHLSFYASDDFMDWFCAYDKWYLDAKLSASCKDYHISLVINLWAFVVSSHTNKAHYLSVVDNTRVCLSKHLPVIDTGDAQFPFDLAWLFGHLLHGFRQWRVDPDPYTDNKYPQGILQLAWTNFNVNMDYKLHPIWINFQTSTAVSLWWLICSGFQVNHC